MLFDLRSRGRRRTVQVIYLLLALVMLSGLLLVGVGTGSGGGLLNAFTNNGSGSNQSSVVAKDLQKAQKQARLHPTSAASWSNVLQAALSKAQQKPDYENAVGYTASGKKDLRTAAAAWVKYQSLVKTPDSNVAVIASKVYFGLGNYTQQATAWNLFATANPTASKGFACWAIAAYLAKNTSTGDAAAAKATALTPKGTSRTQLQAILAEAKGSTSTGAEIDKEYC